MKEITFLDGSVVKITGEKPCLGCWLVENDSNLPSLIRPIIENDKITVAQDVECPIPGFYIIAAKDHYDSIYDFSEDLYSEFFSVLYEVRKSMTDALGIDLVSTFCEEKSGGSHVHYWMLPLHADVMKRHNIKPRIHKGNIATYLDLFNCEDEKSKIQVENVNSYIYSLVLSLLGKGEFEAARDVLSRLVDLDINEVCFLFDDSEGEDEKERKLLLFSEYAGWQTRSQDCSDHRRVILELPL